MKKAIKLKIIIVAVVVVLIMAIPASCMAFLMLGNVDSNSALAASAYDNPERIEELMQLKALGVPADIVMMIVTYQSKDEEEAQTKPFIFIALEFLKMHEEVKVKTHTCSRYDDDGGLVDEEASCNCTYKTVRTNIYEFKNQIEEYIGEVSGGLNASNLLQSAQAAADERSRKSSSDDTRSVSFEAIWFLDYEEAIKRCGIDNEKEIAGFLELHKEGYFAEWLEGAADSFGMNPGGSMVIGGSTHNAIRNAIQRPDLVDMNFFGGHAIIPVPAGSYYISCEFGPRDFAPDPYHTGLDFAAASGTPIYSTMDGIILMRVTNMSSFGHHIVVYHGGGVTTMYAHMVAFGSYKPGDSVERGDVIGYVGTSGLSTGDHLHFEYQINGYASNPRNLLS